ncbi:MAG TPA: hypothetical protein VFH51_20950, partial [Myxococcota bacterium]|nr:hypothetical protein [Myxococcota bacterium]
MPREFVVTRRHRPATPAQPPRLPPETAPGTVTSVDMREPRLNARVVNGCAASLTYSLEPPVSQRPRPVDPRRPPEAARRLAVTAPPDVNGVTAGQAARRGRVDILRYVAAHDPVALAQKEPRIFGVSRYPLALAAEARHQPAVEEILRARA